MSRTEFTDEQFASIYPKGIEGHYWTLARNKLIQRELEIHSLRGKKILEIGCGPGIVVRFLRRAGFNCFGVDLAKVSPVEGVESIVYSGTDFANLPDDFRQSIEVLMLFDVIEHIPNDGEFLDRVHISFPNAKCLVVTVPARSELWSNYDEFNGHHRRYSADSLAGVLSQGGWKVVDVQYLFHVLYIPARLLLRVVGKRKTAIYPPKGLFVYIHKILAWMLVLDGVMLPKRFFGSSAIGVATR